MPFSPISLDTFQKLFESTDKIDMPDNMRKAVNLIQLKTVEAAEQFKDLMKKDRLLTAQSDEFKNTIFHYAAYFGNLHAVKNLLELRAGISNRNQYGLQPFHIAAFFGNSDVVKALAKKGAEHTSVDISVDVYQLSCTPLHMAILNGQIETSRMLLEDPSEHTQDIRVAGLGTIFHLLVLAKNPAMLTELINHPWLTRVQSSALYKESNNRNVTPLSLAACIGNIDAIYVLAKIPGIDINAYSANEKETALHLAAKAENSNVKTIDALLENGAKINVRDEAGCTPLYRAVEMCDDQIVDFLLQNSADPKIADIDGITPQEIAQQRYNEGDKRYEKIIALLNKRKESPLSYSLNQTMMRPPQTNNSGSSINEKFQSVVAEIS